jgi:5-methylthioadenosine/S-adenosylhomocysteine deaminase
MMFHRARHNRIGLLSLIVCLLVNHGWSQDTPQAANITGPLLLIQQASLIITFDQSLGAGPLGTLEDADVLIEGDTIKQVGHGLRADTAKVIQGQGHIVMPGFVDVHNHLYQSLFRGGCGEEDVLGWIEHCNMPVRLAATAAEIYDAVRLSTLDLINSGITTVADWAHLFAPEVAEANVRALSDSGLRFVYGYSQQRPGVEALKQLKRDWIDRNPLAAFQLTSGTTARSREHIRFMVELANELHVPLHVHLLEHIQQRDDDPVQILQDSGALALGGNLLVAHSIHLTEAEIVLLAKHGVRIAHCPLSNMRLASGIIPLPQLASAGLQIGLGLDGGTNDTNDMFSNMRAAVGLQRAATRNPQVFPSVTEVLQMATITGARILGLDAQIGSLTPGKKADVIMLNMRTANFGPRWDWLTQIVFTAQPMNVEYVFVNGRPLKEHGKIVNNGLAEVLDRLDSATGRLKEKMHH